MSFTEKFQSGLQKVLTPVATAVGNNKVIQAISRGCLQTVPITVGVALVSILVNITQSDWSNFLQTTGLYDAGTEAVNVTMSLLALYMVITVSNAYSKIRGYNNLIATVLSLAAFLIMIPSTIDVGDDSTIVALSQDYLGSGGIFVALLLGVGVTAIYCTLMDHDIKIKMPSSVPTMVADSISSCIPSIGIITGAMFVKWLLTLTPWNNLFDLITTIVQTPFMSFGTSPIAFIVFTMICNLLWFCGVHPSALQGAYIPIIIGAIVANTEAFVAGEALPYAGICIVYVITSIGGNGNTLGLCATMFSAKSEKYKAMRKICVVPDIFNINEPMIFGIPLMFNPYYVIPMVLTPLVNGLVGLGIYSIFKFTIYPAFVLSFPWITPACITTFAIGGIIFCLTWFICVALDAIIYMPFFRMDDNEALKQETEPAAQAA